MEKLTPEQALSELVADAQELGIYEQQADQPTPARAEASEGGDPWQAVIRHPAIMAFERDGSNHVDQRMVYDAEDVDRARAAVEAQHRQEIARLKKQRRQLVHEKRDLGNAIDLNVQTIRLMQTQRDEAMAERDALAAQIAGLRKALGTVYDAFRESLLDESYPQADAMARAALAEPGGTDGD